MADPADGLDMLRDRVDRRSRTVPATRRPRRLAPPPDHPQEKSDQEAGGAHPPATEPRSTAISAAPARGSQPHPEDPAVLSKQPASHHPELEPDEPSTNLAIRVRRSLDLRLSDLIHELRHEGIRSSKVELVELLLWELPTQLTPDLRNRLAAFRRLAPRQDRR